MLEWLKSSLVATTLTEQADKLIKMEMALLLEHDNARYPFEKLSGKEKRKSSKIVANGKKQVQLPTIEDFEDEQLKEAARMIDEESSFLRLAMGHDDASIDDYAEAREANAEDLMYFPSRQVYNSASVASNAERLSALQYEFEIIKKHMEVETKKAVRSEQKLKVLTQGYQVRAENLWKQIEALFKEADTLATELESFRMLFRQEQFAAPSRMGNLQTAVKQQNENERKLQLKYENLIVERENWRRLIEEHDVAVAQAAARAASEAEAAARAAAEAEAVLLAVAEAEAAAAAQAAAEAEAVARAAAEAAAAARAAAEAEAVARAAAEAAVQVATEAEAVACADAEGGAAARAATEAEAAAQAAVEAEAGTYAAVEAQALARAATEAEPAAQAAAEAEAVACADAEAGAAECATPEAEAAADAEAAAQTASEAEAVTHAVAEAEVVACAVAVTEAEGAAQAPAEDEAVAHSVAEAEAATGAAQVRLPTNDVIYVERKHMESSI